MGFRGDDRAQALQVGAILLFGFLVLSLSLYQATVVPDQNRGVEFNAYQEAASDLTDLRNDVITAASKDTTTGTNVKTGAEYPSRSVFINPGPPIGELRTTAQRNVSIENVTAVDGESANTERYIENELAGRNYSTRDVRLTPEYNVFDGQPMVVTGQQAYRYTTGADSGRYLPMTGQTLIQGDQLNLLFIGGDLSARGTTTTVTTEPVSASTRTVTVTGDGSDITLELTTPPGISAQTWVNRTGEPLNASNSRVLNVEPHGDRIRITLDGSRTYKLKLAKVEVREENDVSELGDTTGEYVITTSPATQSLQTGSRTELTVEVRDRFNNPVAGEQVTFTRNRGEFVVDGTKTNTTTVTTNSEGKATVVYSATNGDNTIDAGSVSVAASIGDASYETATFDIGVTESSGGTSLTFADLQVLTAEPGGPNATTGIIMDLRNGGTENFTITAITVTKTDTDAELIKEDDNEEGKWDREIFINVNDSDPDTKDANDGYYEAGSSNSLSIGSTANLTTGDADTAELLVGESAKAYLFEFRKSGGGSGGGNTISMEFKYVKLTIHYETEDGEKESITTTVFVI